MSCSSAEKFCSRNFGQRDHEQQEAERHDQLSEHPRADECQCEAADHEHQRVLLQDIECRKTAEQVQSAAGQHQQDAAPRAPQILTQQQVLAPPDQERNDERHENAVAVFLAAEPDADHALDRRMKRQRADRHHDSEQSPHRPRRLSLCVRFGARWHAH